MYIEIAQVCSILFCSSVFRLPNMPSFLAQCVGVAKDLEGTQFPLLARHCGPLAILMHTLTTLYRTRGSSVRPKLLIFFWVGINYDIMVKVLMFTSLVLVEKSFFNINKDLQLILTQRSRENSKFLETLVCRLRERYSRAADLRLSIEQVFGPDILCGSFFAVFKISFHFYHVYDRKDLALLGQNTLVGEFTGYFILAQLLTFMFYLAYICDSLSTKVLPDVV